MDELDRVAREHLELTRRYFLGLTVVGAAGLNASLAWGEPDDAKILADAVAKLSYLTPVDRFRMFVLSYRTIDANGAAQPMPRPFAKGGNNAIHQVPVVVDA